LPEGKPERRPATNVIDLVAVLQQSLEASGKAPPAKGKSKRKSTSAAKKKPAHRKGKAAQKKAA
jgi:non-homologous end joining protein Ku